MPDSDEINANRPPLNNYKQSIIYREIVWFARRSMEMLKILLMRIVGDGGPGESDLRGWFGVWNVRCSTLGLLKYWYYVFFSGKYWKRIDVTFNYTNDLRGSGQYCHSWYLGIMSISDSRALTCERKGLDHWWSMLLIIIFHEVDKHILASIIKWK